MKCPNCGIDITDERRLLVINGDRNEEVPWYKLSPPKKLACPECGTALKHKSITLIIAGTAAAGLLVVSSLKLLFPDNDLFLFLFPVFVIGVIVILHLLMNSKIKFNRDDL